MIFKKIYNNLFNLSTYRGYIEESLLKPIIYVFVLSLISGVLFGGIGYFKLKPIISKNVDYLYNSIPDFSVSSEGLNIEPDNIMSFSFAGKNFYIDGNKNLMEVVIEKDFDSAYETYLITKDGYGVIKGNILESGNFYSDMQILKDIELTKSDFTIIYESLKLMNKDILILIIIAVIISLSLSVFLRSFIYAVILKIVSSFKNEKISYKDAYKISLYGHSFYIIYAGIFLLSNMVVSNYFKMIFLEIISVLYIVNIALKIEAEVK